MILGAEHAACLSTRGGAQGVPCLLAMSTSRHTDASTHAGTSAHASHAEDNHAVRFQGLRFVICVYCIYFVYIIYSATQRHHDAFGAGLPPSLIQAWNDTNNDKVCADSIFETIHAESWTVRDGTFSLGSS